MTLLVKAQAKLLKCQVGDKMQRFARNVAIECINAAELFITKLFDWMLSEYHSIFKVSGESVDSSVSDKELISSAVKAIFRELQLLRVGGQLKITLGHKAWAMMNTMKLQEALSEDFNNHEIVVN